MTGVFHGLTKEHGTVRLTQIRKLVGDISQKMPTKTLRQMAYDGLVQRTIYTVIPRHACIGAEADLIGPGPAAVVAYPCPHAEGFVTAMSR